MQWDDFSQPTFELITFASPSNVNNINVFRITNSWHPDTILFFFFVEYSRSLRSKVWFARKFVLSARQVFSFREKWNSISVRDFHSWNVNRLEIDIFFYFFCYVKRRSFNNFLYLEFRQRRMQYVCFVYSILRFLFHSLATLSMFS